jgi:hypothetical protein
VGAQEYAGQRPGEQERAKRDPARTVGPAREHQADAVQRAGLATISDAVRGLVDWLLETFVNSS